MELRARELAQMARERAVYAELMQDIRRPKRARLTPGLEIVCIGNAGGADNVVHGRPSGGLLLRYDGRTVVIDPGDNSLAFLAGLGFDAYDITDVLVSHAHNDHVGDLASAISAATNLALGRSDSHIVVCPSLADYNAGSSTKFGFTLPAYAWKADVQPLYWQDLEVTRFDGVPVRSRCSMRISKNIKVSAAEAQHDHIMVTGFVIDTPLGRLGYTGDTQYFPGLAAWYAGCDVLWMNMNTLALDAIGDTQAAVADRAAPVHNHLGYVGVCSLIEEVRPRTAIVSHFGAQLLDQRHAIEAMLRDRFAGSGTAIYCPGNGDSFTFEASLSQAPEVGGFVP